MKRILLVDDNPHDRLLYRRYLGQQMGPENIELVEAASGEEGLALFQAQRPDCVLLDYNLPDTDGLAMLEQLKELAPPDALCVVMITGGGSETLAVRVLNSGAMDYLVKQQFDRELLGKTVRHAIEKNEWRQYVGRYHTELQAVNRQLRESLDELMQTRQELHERNAQLSAANEAIGARNAQLDRTNQDLDNFVYAASHDLRQPVTNLRGLFEELRRTASFEDQEAATLLRLFDDSLHSLSTTITDLAAVVQEQRRPEEPTTEPVSLASLTTEVLQSLRPQLLETAAQIDTDFAALPMVQYERSNLRTILLNLVNNSLKYRHPHRRPHVQIRTYLHEDRPFLEIKDNGLGMDLERDGSKLFHLFQRLHPETSEGTGVGLFLVNRLVQAAGGGIFVDSQKDQGTTFQIQLLGEAPGTTPAYSTRPLDASPAS